MRYPITSQSNAGFTLMEVMVSISIFTIIMVIGISSLLTINISNSQSRSDREAMDKVSFLLESMTRKIRTGVLDVGTQNGIQSTLTFTNQFGDIEQYDFSGGTVIYNFTRCSLQGIVCTYPDPAETYNIAPPTNLVQINDLSFEVFGANASPSDGQQAYVIIRISGTASEKHQQTPFAIQTAVSQRQLQI